MKWREVFFRGKWKARRTDSKDEDKKKEEEKKKKKEIEQLMTRVKELERILQEYSAIPNEAEPPGIAQLPERDPPSESSATSSVRLESVGFDLTNDIPTMSSLLRAMTDDGLNDYYHQQGIFARPECQQRYHYGKSKGKQRERDRELSRSKSGRKVKNSDELVSHYCAISTLGPVMKNCKELWWKRSMYTPVAKHFIHAPLPRITLNALQAALWEHQDPCSLQIFKKEEVSMEEVFETYSGQWGELPLDIVWANQAKIHKWGQDNLEDLIKFFDNKMVKPKSYLQVQESMNFSIFMRGDLQPKRHMYFYYGSKPGVREEACASIWQAAPVLVEVNNKVYFGLFSQVDAPLKYPKEVKNIVTRAHCAFKYTETALTIFTPCGTILQQNPSSCKIFGMEACGNNLFSDFDKDGKPVNRLRALFGDNESQYNEMMETVMEKHDGVWCSRMKLGREHLMPEPKLGRSLSESSGTVDSILFSSGEHCQEGHTNNDDSSVWYTIQLLKFSDPADGKTAIFCEMENIHKVVLQEEKLRAAKKHEYEILQSIIPKHIIQDLIEKEKDPAKVTTLSPTSSRRVDNFLLSVMSYFKIIDMSYYKMIDDSKVSETARHYSQVTVFFADIVGFTNMSSHSTPADIMIMLNRLFTLFDDISDNHNIYKVETIGDAYMCVAGLDMRSETSHGEQVCCEDKTCSKYHASRMLLFAKDILSNAKTVTSPQNTPVEVRIGLHTGDVIAGVVGYKMPRFCLFGDTVNVASRMESTGRASHIHASQMTRDLVPDEHWIATGGVEVKGKGVIESFIL